MGPCLLAEDKSEEDPKTEAPVFDKVTRFKLKIESRFDLVRSQQNLDRNFDLLMGRWLGARQHDISVMS